jgi:hypothetical protein
VNQRRICDDGRMSFQVPQAYAALFEAGRFDYWGVPYQSMTHEQREARYAERRRKVLWLDGIEWDPQRSPANIAASPESDDTLPGLVAFAGNGAGDSYSWYLPWQEGPEPPVLFCPHDLTVADYFAPDFARALERLWLRHGAWHEGRPADQLVADLEAWLDIIAPYLDPQRVRFLMGLAEIGTPAGFKTAENELVARWPHADDKLPAHNLLSTLYMVEYLGKDALRLYDESIALYQRLVIEGHPRFAARLAETRRNRDAAAAELARKKPAAKKKAKKKPPAKKKAVAKKKPPKKRPNKR